MVGTVLSKLFNQSILPKIYQTAHCSRTKCFVNNSYFLIYCQFKTTVVYFVSLCINGRTVVNRSKKMTCSRSKV